MRSGTARLPRHVVSLGLIGIVAVLLTGCTGRGGGQLPPQPGFSGAASFGFTFSCEDKGGTNPPTGRLHIELAYAEKGSYLFRSAFGSAFGIHGIADTIDPVVESKICIGQNPPPGGNELIFLGRYRPTTSSPAGFTASCPARETSTSPLCRFEVIVQDNDRNRAASTGDFFSIKLSTATAVSSTLPAGAVIYARAGVLSSGNLTVD